MSAEPRETPDTLTAILGLEGASPALRGAGSIGARLKRLPYESVARWARKHMSEGRAHLARTGLRFCDQEATLWRRHFTTTYLRPFNEGRIGPERAAVGLLRHGAADMRATRHFLASQGGPHGRLLALGVLRSRKTLGEDLFGLAHIAGQSPQWFEHDGMAAFLIETGVADAVRCLRRPSQARAWLLSPGAPGPWMRLQPLRLGPFHPAFLSDTELVPIRDLARRMGLPWVNMDPEGRSGWIQSSNEVAPGCPTRNPHMVAFARFGAPTPNEGGRRPHDGQAGSSGAPGTLGGRLWGPPSTWTLAEAFYGIQHLGHAVPLQYLQQAVEALGLQPDQLADLFHQFIPDHEIEERFRGQA